MSDQSPLQPQQPLPQQPLTPEPAPATTPAVVTEQTAVTGKPRRRWVTGVGLALAGAAVGSVVTAGITTQLVANADTPTDRPSLGQREGGGPGGRGGMGQPPGQLEQGTAPDQQVDPGQGQAPEGTDPSSAPSAPSGEQTS